MEGRGTVWGREQEPSGFGPRRVEEQTRNERGDRSGSGPETAAELSVDD
jgi:hypothetical protein